MIAAGTLLVPIMVVVVMVVVAAFMNVDLMVPATIVIAVKREVINAVMNPVVIGEMVSIMSVPATLVLNVSSLALPMIQTANKLVSTLKSTMTFLLKQVVMIALKQ